MIVQCDCGAFQAELTGYPKNSPGRLVCYCKDCQAYLQKLGREDLLDTHGGTEVYPVYPSEIRIISGADKLQCNRLTQRGLNRWSTTCCNAPIANTAPGFPWVGFLHSAFKANDAASPAALGPIRSRVFGRDAKGNPPFKIAEKLDFKAVMAVFPFILKGKMFGKSKNNPFFQQDGKTPIKAPKLL